jgi:hypothetical protein
LAHAGWHIARSKEGAVDECRLSVFDETWAAYLKGLSLDSRFLIRIPSKEMAFAPFLNQFRQPVLRGLTPRILGTNKDPIRLFYQDPATVCCYVWNGEQY